MHERGKMAAAPAFDAARRGDAWGTPLPARRTASIFFFFFRFRIHADLRRFGSNAGRLAPIRAESDRIGRIPVCFGRKKEIGRRKKKKNLKPKIPVDLIHRCRRLHWP